MAKRNKNILIPILIGIFLMGIFAVAGGYKLFAVTGTSQEEVRLLVPHLGTISCEVVDTAVVTYTIPEQGFWIREDALGTHTNNVEDIQVEIQRSVWEKIIQTGGRFTWRICDAKGLNCGEEKTKVYHSWGTNVLPIQTIDLTKNSIHIKYEISYAFFIWRPSGDSLVKFKYDKFGLAMYSTLTGFRKKICLTSCDLNCPIQEERKSIVYTTKDSLDFNEAVNYLEYWSEVSMAGQQFGGTIWMPDRQEFCFGGSIYKAETLRMNDGTVYKYPHTYIKQVQCCRGATVSITGGEKICQPDFTWKTILDEEDLPECKSDFSCPNQGQTTCTAKLGEYYTSGFFCNPEGNCEKKTDKKVDCCPANQGCASDQICQTPSYTCVGGADEPPVDETGNGTIITKCKNCDEFAMSKIFGETGIFPDKKCKPTLLALPPQTTLTCAFSFIKLALIPIILIFASLFGFGLFDDLLKKSVKTEGTRKLIAFFLSLMIAGILAWLVFILFWVGIIVFIIFILIRFIIKFINPI